MSGKLHYYEDLKVGQVFRTAEAVVTREEIVGFAARYDPQGHHLDPEAGRETAFGGLVASGWLTGALTMRLIVAGELELAGGFVGLGIDELKWPRAVRPGDRIRAQVEILSMRLSASKPRYGVVKIRAVTTNQDGDTVQTFVAHQLVLRAPVNPPGKTRG
jgi:acyl dehydratase